MNHKIKVQELAKQSLNWLPNIKILLAFVYLSHLNFMEEIIY